eukprot:Gb_21367 [translate_table: standard]
MSKLMEKEIGYLFPRMLACVDVERVAGCAGRSTCILISSMRILVQTRKNL